MAHEKKDKGSWKGKRDKHQGGEKRASDADKRKNEKGWTKQGKDTNNKKPPKKGSGNQGIFNW